MPRLIVYGRLAGINEYTEQCRKNPYAGATMKKTAQVKVEWAIAQQLKGYKAESPVRLAYTFYEPNRRRDKDNVAGFAHKVIQDALVHSGVLKGDGWDYIDGFSDDFAVDRESPRIEIDIREAGK